MSDVRPIDANALINAMYHEAFETDTEMQRWDSGCWIMYKMFENAVDNAPTIEPTVGLIAQARDCGYNNGYKDGYKEGEKKKGVLHCEGCRFHQWVNDVPACLKHMSSEWKLDDYCSKAEPIPARDCAWK